MRWDVIKMIKREKLIEMEQNLFKQQFMTNFAKQIAFMKIIRQFYNNYLIQRNE